MIQENVFNLFTTLSTLSKRWNTQPLKSNQLSGETLFFLECLCNKCNKCATLSLYCTFGVWRVVKGTCFTTYKEDISIKWELPLEHHQVLLSSLACTRRAEPKRWLPLHLKHTATKTHIHMLSNAAKCVHVILMHAHTTHISAAQWGTSIQLA